MSVKDKLTPDLVMASRNLMTFGTDDLKKISAAVIEAFESEEDSVVELPELSEPGKLNMKLIKGKIDFPRYLEEIQILNASM